MRSMKQLPPPPLNTAIFYLVQKKELLHHSSIVEKDVCYAVVACHPLQSLE